jgi:hypothetical protein
MKYSVDDKVLSFILLNSLPNTPAWEMFKYSVVNTVEESKLTFDSIETASLLKTPDCTLLDIPSQP